MKAIFRVLIGVEVEIPPEEGATEQEQLDIAQMVIVNTLNAGQPLGRGFVVRVDSAEAV